MTPANSAHRSHVPPVILWLPMALMLAVCGIELVTLLGINDGKFVYTLDDPYIHFAVAENLLNGHYGVNATEPSAPSSSVVWTLILTPFAALSGFEYVAFFLNLVAAAITVMLYSRIVAAAVTTPEQSRARFWLAVTMAVVLVPATNVVGLVFTGMEHSLQVLAAAAVAAGLIRESRDGKVALWLLAAIVAGPLLRYENLAISVPALGYLFLRGHRRAAVLTGLATLAPLVLFSLFLKANDLGWMPTSVNAKSDVVTSDGAASSLAANLIENLDEPQGLVIAALTILLGVYAALPRHATAERLLAASAAVGCVLHLFVGKIGWYGRYEIYIHAYALLISIYVWREPLCAFVDRQRPVLAIPLTAIVVLFLGSANGQILATIPIASNNIYQQQYQMHRFIDEYYQAPVAVNDLGWPSYRNDHYVLDLYGLASREALEYRLTGSNADWMNELASRYDVKLAIIYDQWFRTLPPNWRRVGRIYLGRPLVTPAFSSVAIYALDDSTEAKAIAMLDDFAGTLPEGVIFVSAADEVASSR